MTSSDSFREIVKTYQKFGWVLRRLLLSSEARKRLGGDIVELDRDMAIKPSPTDAAWFSRPPAKGEIAWELRYLGDPPFAILEYLDEQEDVFEEKLGTVETRLTDTLTQKKQA